MAEESGEEKRPHTRCSSLPETASSITDKLVFVRYTSGVTSLRLGAQHTVPQPWLEKTSSSDALGA